MVGKLSSGISHLGEGHFDVDVGVVVDAFDVEAEQPQKIVVIALDVGDLVDVGAADGLPQFADLSLDIGAHFQIVDAHAAFGIGGDLGQGPVVVEPVPEQAVNLLDAVFMHALGLHHFHQEHKV